MQDIGGCRIILADNAQIDRAWEIIRKKTVHRFFQIVRHSDYRELGRVESGYRALHLIAERDSREIEVQIRTKIQHAWAEEIERTSIIYKGTSNTTAYFWVGKEYHM